MHLPEKNTGVTQTKILHTILRADAPMSVEGLTRHLSISRNATYQHIMALERDELIKKARVTQTKGRPSQTFQLTEKGKSTFPKHYGLFAKLLVTLVKSRIGSQELRDCMEELGGSLAEEFRERIISLKGDDLIIEVSKIMQELGYEAEAVPNENNDGLQIRAYNCVFHDLAKEHEEVCALDTSFISTLLGRSVDHTECVVRGGTNCQFCPKGMLRQS